MQKGQRAGGARRRGTGNTGNGEGRRVSRQHTGLRRAARIEQENELQPLLKGRGIEVRALAVGCEMGKGIDLLVTPEPDATQLLFNLVELGAQNTLRLVG